MFNLKSSLLLFHLFSFTVQPVSQLFSNYYNSLSNAISLTLTVYFVPRRDAKKILQSVCLHVSLSVGLLLSAHISQKTHVQSSQNLLYILPEAVAQSSSDNNAILVCYVFPLLWAAIPHSGRCNYLSQML